MLSGGAGERKSKGLQIMYLYFSSTVKKYIKPDGYTLISASSLASTHSFKNISCLAEMKQSASKNKTHTIVHHSVGLLSVLHINPAVMFHINPAASSGTCINREQRGQFRLLLIYG